MLRKLGVIGFLEVLCFLSFLIPDCFSCQKEITEEEVKTINPAAGIIASLQVQEIIKKHIEINGKSPLFFRMKGDNKSDHYLLLTMHDVPLETLHPEIVKIFSEKITHHYAEYDPTYQTLSDYNFWDSEKPVYVVNTISKDGKNYPQQSMEDEFYTKHKIVEGLIPSYPVSIPHFIHYVTQGYKNLKPWVYIYLHKDALLTKANEKKTPRYENGMDFALLKEAEKRQIIIAGLELPSDHVYISEKYKITKEQVIEYFETTLNLISNPSEKEETSSEEEKAFSQAHHEALSMIYHAGYLPFFNSFLKNLFEQEEKGRNHFMFERMKIALKELKENSSALFAVGAAHGFGEYGLLKRLETAGIEVERLSAQGKFESFKYDVSM